MTANLMNGTIMHTRSTELTWRGLVALATAAYLVLEGCIPITEAVKEGPVVKEVRAVHTQGNIEVNVLPHPDNQGWTVRLSQPILREVEERRDVTVLRRYYYWQPLALPAGLFACPTSTWAWAWHIVTPMAAPEIRRNLAHYTVEACLLALMIADTTPEDLRGTAYGFFSLVSGLAMLLASVLAGWLWDAHGAAFTFVAGAALSAIALIGVLLLRPGRG